MESSDVTILKRFPRFCSHNNFEVIVDKIYQKKEVIVEKCDQYIYISCPNSTINEHKNYINAPTLINKVHRFRHGVDREITWNTQFLVL